MSTCAWVLWCFMSFLGGYQTRGAVRSKHATFVERRKNPRNEVTWDSSFRDSQRCIEPNRMAALGAPWSKENA